MSYGSSIGFLLATVPTALVFFAAYAAARPTARRVALASWTMCTITAIIGLVTPAVSISFWLMNSAMSAGAQTGIPPILFLRIIAGVPYYLWFAATIAPIATFSKARRWDMVMHFVYAPIYAIFYSYSLGSAGGSMLVTQGIVIASLIAFWYRLADLQTQQKTT